MRLNKIFFLLFLLPPLFSISAKDFQGDTISIKNFKTGLELDTNWRYKEGDIREAAAINFDDRDWKFISEDDRITHKGIIWFRTNFYIDSTIDEIPLALRFRTNSACDIFVDGKLVRSLGKVDEEKSKMESGFTIMPVTIPISTINKGWHLISVRTSTHGTGMQVRFLHINSTSAILNFEAELISMQRALELKEEIRIFTIPMFFSGVFLVLSFFHLVLFLYYRRVKSNLYYSLFTFILFLLFFGIYMTMSGTNLETVRSSVATIIIAFFLTPLFFLGILYEVFYKRILKLFWILLATIVAAFILFFIFDSDTFGSLLIVFYILASIIETIRVFIKAWAKKKEGSRIFIFGLFFPVNGVIFLSIMSWLLDKLGFQNISTIISDNTGEFFLYAMLMSVSLSMTIYLGRDFSRINHKLQDQLVEIKQLFGRTVEQENERKRILENQKEELERMVVVRTEEVVQQKAVIEQKNRDIFDNLMYARRIQEAILPDTKLIFQSLRDSFIIYWPKDIVSGDFYSFSQKEGKVIFSAADCTGHGVTGAFMSMIGSSLINQIVNERNITKPSEILNNLNNEVSAVLKQSDTEVNDGMDIAICNFDLANLKLQYAGANRPLWYFQNGVFNEVKPDKMAIGGLRIHRSSFLNHEIQLKKGESIYLFTDGFADQFGGDDGRKLLSKNLKSFLASIQQLNMKEQEKKLTEYFIRWKGVQTQVDDILAIGIRI